MTNEIFSFKLFYFFMCFAIHKKFINIKIQIFRCCFSSEITLKYGKIQNNIFLINFN